MVCTQRLRRYQSLSSREARAKENGENESESRAPVAK